MPKVHGKSGYISRISKTDSLDLDTFVARSLRDFLVSSSSVRRAKVMIFFLEAGEDNSR